MDKHELSNKRFISQNMAAAIMPEEDCIFTVAYDKIINKPTVINHRMKFQGKFDEVELKNKSSREKTKITPHFGKSKIRGRKREKITNNLNQRTFLDMENRDFQRRRRERIKNQQKHFSKKLWRTGNCYRSWIRSTETIRRPWL